MRKYFANKRRNIKLKVRCSKKKYMLSRESHKEMEASASSDGSRLLSFRRWHVLSSDKM